MTGEPECPGAGTLSVIRAYAATDARILWRMKTPVVFMLLLPAMLVLLLGPAVTGLSGRGAQARSLLGFSVMFSFMTINYAGLALFREFVGDTWVRQATYRPPKAAYLLGKLVPVAVAGMLQLTLLGALAFTVLGLPLHGSILQLVLLEVSTVAVGSLAGILLHNLTANTSSFQSLTFLLVLGSGGLGGAVVAPERLPAFSRNLSPFTPHYWVLRALDAATEGSGSWVPVWDAVARLGTACVILAGACLLTLDYANEKSVAA